MASEAEFSELSSLIERLINSRNRDLALFLPFMMALTNIPINLNNPDQDSVSPDQENEENQTQTGRESRDRIILINPLTQGMVVIEGRGGGGDSSSSTSSLENLMRDLLLNNNKSGQPPASKASIEALPTAEICTDGEECSICLEEWEIGGMAKEMPCKHKFHGECIEKWLNLHGSCPICRHKMPVDENFDKNKSNEGENSGRRRELWVSFSFANNGSNSTSDSSSYSSSAVDQNTDS
ncbi:hypothetical protein M9H77_09967 [Catharanthus roseus]|uniref:Uncharacterized protein n=1 Tax=Catharanthus roseus TaxID=4058 RepID=A0ACC0C2G2_CATRO|nr:hypothetical protein M9H77_09967 [Catharanthus roseus]